MYIHFTLFSYYTKEGGISEGASKQAPDPKNSTAHPVLKFLDPLLDVEWVRRGWDCGPNTFQIQR